MPSVCTFVQRDVSCPRGWWNIGTTSGRKIRGGARVSVRKTGFFAMEMKYPSRLSITGGGRGEKFFREFEKSRVGKMDIFR